MFLRVGVGQSLVVGRINIDNSDRCIVDDQTVKDDLLQEEWYQYMETEISHWFPIITRCPLSVWPDFIKITLLTTQFIELYEARRRMRQLVSGKRMFMEDIAKMVLQQFPEADACTVKLWMGPHSTTVYR